MTVEAADTTDPSVHVRRARLSVVRGERAPVDRDVHETALALAEVRTTLTHLIDAFEASQKQSKARADQMDRRLTAIKNARAWPTPRELGALLTTVLIAAATWWNAIHPDATPIQIAPPAAVVPKDEP